MTTNEQAYDNLIDLIDKFREQAIEALAEIRDK